MARQLRDFNAVLKHVYSEPRFVAWSQWHHEHPSVMQQLVASVPRHELEDFVDGKGWADPDRVITLSVSVDTEPDWDWWEPTSEWRRQAARDREFDQRRRR